MGSPAGEKLNEGSKIVRSILHLCGLSNIADAMTELDHLRSPRLSDVSRFPKTISTFLMQSQATEYREVCTEDKNSAVDALEKLLVNAPSREIIGKALRDSSDLREYLLHNGGTRVRTNLFSTEAAAYFDTLLDRACVLISNWVLEEDTGGLTERAALSDMLQTLERVERTLARISKVAQATEVDKTEQDRRFRSFTLRYVQRLRERMDWLEIPGIELRGTRRRYEFSSAYVPLQLRDSRGVLSTIREPSDLLAGGAPTLIIGDAGSGKTTLAKLVMVGLAQEAEIALVNHGKFRVPLLVKARSQQLLPPALDDLGSDLVRTLVLDRPLHWQRELLKAGAAVVVVDGLDEIQDSARESLVSWIDSLVQEYPALPVIVTSRPAALKSQKFIPIESRQLFVQPLNRSQIRKLAAYWHTTVARDAYSSDHEATTEAMAFLSRVYGQPELRLLCENPLLIASLCGLAAAKRGALSSQRAEVYRQFIRMLVYERNLERYISSQTVDISMAQTLQMYRKIAAHFQKEGLDEAPLEDYLNVIREFQDSVNDGVIADLRPGVLLDYLLERTGLLREIPVDRIDWSHKSFKEYLAAEAIVAAGHEKGLLRKAESSEWQEVVAWVIELLPTASRASRFIESLLTQAEVNSDSRLMAIALTGASRAVELPKRTRLRAEACTSALLPPKNEIEARQIVQMGDGAVSALKKALDESPPRHESRIVQCLLDIGTETAIAVLAGMPIARLSKHGQSLGASYCESASADLASRVLRQVAGVAVFNLDLEGDDFLDSLANVRLPYIIRRLKLDGTFGGADLISRAGTEIALLDALDVTPEEASQIVVSVGTVTGLCMTWGSAAPVGLDSLLVSKIRRLLLRAGSVELAAVTMFDSLKVLVVKGHAIGNLSDISNGPPRVIFDDANDVTFAGATQELWVRRWDSDSFDALSDLAQMTILCVEEADFLTSLDGLPPSTEDVFIRECPSMAPLDWDYVFSLPIRRLRLGRLPYLGANVSQEQMDVLGIFEVPVGHGSSEFPELHMEHWTDRECDASGLSSDELRARGWDDWSFWEEVGGDADDWAGFVGDDVSEDWAGSGFLLMTEEEFHEYEDTASDEADADSPADLTELPWETHAPLCDPW